MKKIIAMVVIFSLVPLLARGAGLPDDFEKNWPQWRGPHANGVAPYGNPPVEWSENKNVKWKIGLPGKGHATPIIWGDRVFVLTAIETDKQGEPRQETQTQGGGRPGRRGPRRVTTSNVYKFAIFAINRSDGKIQWQKTAREELPHEGTHATGSWASNSPVTDGENVYAYFGSRGLYCYDMQGNLKWEKDLGDMTIMRGFGEGSSPVLHGDKIIVNWDHEGQSFIIALDKRSGKELWKVDRDEGTSWATPLVVDNNGKQQVITSATNRVRSYDLTTGELLWESSGMTRNTIPSPVAADGMVYVMSGFRGSALQAIRLSSAKGNVIDSGAIAWKLERDTPYAPSPLLYNEMLYFLKGNDGILACFNGRTGEEYFSRQRLEGIENVFASPVGAGDHVYIVDRSGATAVVKHGSRFELLFHNMLDDGFSASPAIAGKEIYLRGHKNLYCISQE